ncbi:MAG: aromatic-ring-hydroxylating dioxygenase subunit beta [Hyphomonadaceae bacterium]|nr:aromatic-ring-hydroxylating dioxygenase subunit beta [Hyphomonadaceae bacterium]
MRARVEDFLHAEAELLDSWRLSEWLELFTQDAVYEVPSTDLDEKAQPDNNLFYIADDHERLRERITRLLKRDAHAEQPRSKTVHLVSNIRVAALEDGELGARAAFVVYRAKGGVIDTYVGRSRYTLRPSGDTFQIREKRCVLAMDGLRPQGRISIIL